MARTKRVTGMHPLSYMGVEATTPPQLIERDIDPTSEFNQFNIGTIWVNTLTEDVWMLTDLTGGVASWTLMSHETLVINGDTGTATEDNGEVNIIGSGVLNTAGATDTLTLGMTAATDGQLIIAGTGIVPAWGTVTSGDGTITITAGPNSLDITRTGGGGATTFHTDAGNAVTAGAAITIAGGTNLNTAGAVNTVTVNLDNDVTISGKMTSAALECTSLQSTDLTAGFLESDGAGNVTNSEGTDGQLIIAATGAAAAWANLTSAAGTMQITEGANTINLESIAGLASPYALIWTDGGPGGTAISGIGDDGTTLVVTHGSTVFASTTLLDSSWTNEGVAGSALADIHVRDNDETAAVMATQDGSNYTVYHATTPTAAYTKYIINATSTGDTFTSINHDGFYWMITGTSINGGTNGIHYDANPASGAWTFNSVGLTSQALNDSAYGGGRWVVVGDNGKIAYNDTDPIGAWTDIPDTNSGFDETSSAAIHITSITYATALGLFVAVSNEARIATSPDGINWTQRDSEGKITGTSFTDIHWDSTNGILSAMSSTDVVMSYNGIKWFRDPSVSASNCKIMGDLNGNGIMFTSTDADKYFVVR